MIHCGQCGGRVYEEDRFCGNCGVSVPRDVDRSIFDEPDNSQGTEDTKQFVPTAISASHGPGRSGRGVPVLLLSSVVVLAVLLGAGAFALIRLDSLGSMAGEAEPPTAGEQAGAPGSAAPRSTVEDETYPEATQIDPAPTVTGPPDETIEDEEGSVGSSAGLTAEEEAVEEAIYGHYEAIGNSDFAEAYSYFSFDFQSRVPAQGWIEEQETFDITDSTVFSAEVEEIEGSSATASVEVGFEDNTGSPAFAITWELLEEGGEWRLDEQADAEKIR